jgi:Rrf2 family transcriptional regulator, iron-sulfur cluster assembly transcription factor
VPEASERKEAQVRLTRGTDYGARGVIYLAKQPANAVALVGDIAREEGVPESYLAKIFQDLTKGGILRSHRGAKGGFSLARPAHEITLRQVIESVEGPIALSRCLDPFESCDRLESCALYPILQQAQEQLLGLFGNTTLQELAAEELALLAPHLEE